LSILKVVFAILFLCCVIDSSAIADDGGDNIGVLIEAGVAVSDLQIQNCRKMYQLKADRYVCGYLKVPENYGAASNKIIKIPFLVIIPEESSFDNTLEPLLVTGGGGPGNALLGPGEYGILDDEFWTYEEMSVVDGRVLVILENRGAGMSQPNLDCHYQPEVFRLDYWQELLKSDFACGNTFRDAGIDLSQYNVRNAALDIEVFRRLYGKQGVNTKQLNLYGISYGTRVAMYYEKLFPLATRSMVLDSVVVSDQESVDAGLEYAQRSFDLVFSRCRADRACRERFGAGLEREFYKFLGEVDSLNLSLVVSWPDDLMPFEVPMTGSLIVNVLHDALYSSDTIAEIPLTIRTMINGSFDRLTTGVREHIFTYSSRYTFSDTAFLTYLCFDEDHSGKSESELAGLKLYRYWNLAQGRQYMYRVCTEYGIAAEPGWQLLSGSINTPTLFLSGEYDPVTPPANAARVAENTAYHWNIVRENISHDVISHSSCARLLASWFIYHLEEDLDERAADCDVTGNSLQFLLY